VGKNKATLADVARMAGVSSATASRVLNDTGQVSEDVRMRIEAAIETLGYEPRKSSPAAAADHDATIAVLTGDLRNPYFSEIINGIQNEIDNYGMILTLYSITDHAQRQQMLVEKLMRRRPEGVITIGTDPFPDLIEWQQKQKIPLVVINRRVNLPQVHCIGMDFENSMYRVTQHLISLKHERIGFISEFFISEIALARRHGIEMALAEAGFGLRPEDIITVSKNMEAEGGFQAMTALMMRPVENRPTAVIAFNDVTAIGALHAAHASGLRVPQDVSVTGVDDILAAAYSYPPLTTIGQSKFRMGVLSVQHICGMDQESFHSSNNFTLLESPLIVRESTGLAP